MNERELLFVMGHEMGHYALGHVWQLIALSALLIMASFYVAYRTAWAVLARYGVRFGFATLADIASLPLLLILTGVFSLVITPAELAFTRHVEHEADRFGLEITQANHSAATAFVKLQTDALAVPRPGLLFTLWRASHPPLGERIDFANEYHPWRVGQPLVYGDRFKP
jgi:STE24 endopeptidase